MGNCWRILQGDAGPLVCVASVQRGAGDFEPCEGGAGGPQGGGGGVGGPLIDFSRSPPCLKIQGHWISRDQSSSLTWSASIPGLIWTQTYAELLGVNEGKRVLAEEENGDIRLG